MSDISKFKTIFGTWIHGSDVENPDELEDPGDYYDWLSSERPMKTEYGFEEDNEDPEDEEEEGDDDDDDFLF